MLRRPSVHAILVMLPPFPDIFHFLPISPTAVINGLLYLFFRFVALFSRVSTFTVLLSPMNINIID